MISLNSSCGSRNFEEGGGGVANKHEIGANTIGGHLFTTFFTGRCGEMAIFQINRLTIGTYSKHLYTVFSTSDSSDVLMLSKVRESGHFQ